MERIARAGTTKALNSTARDNRERWLVWRSALIGGGWAYLVREPGWLRLIYVAVVGTMWTRAWWRYRREVLDA